MPSPSESGPELSRNATNRNESADQLGLVMTGGGARAAYQVGFLRCLARHYPELRIPILTGVSAGAINVAHLAAHHGTFKQAVDELSHLWETLTIPDVFRADARALLLNVLRWGTKLVSGGMRGPPKVRGLVDTQPLRDKLTEALHCVDGEITGIPYNLSTGRLKAAAISTSSYSTGQSVTWIQGRDIEEWERPHRYSRHTELTVDHVLASCALPLFFPAVEIEGRWYGDGGIRLSTPLSPALHLGAERIIVVSTAYGRSKEEAGTPSVAGYPPPAQVVSILISSVFLDLLDQNSFVLERMNRLLRKIPEEDRMGLRIVDALTLRPSQDLGKIAGTYEPGLPRTFRFLMRGLGTKETSSPDALSLVLFQPDYVHRLMDLGETDAEAQLEKISAFIEGGGSGDRTLP